MELRSIAKKRKKELKEIERFEKNFAELQKEHDLLQEKHTAANITYNSMLNGI